jgi:hypothetical protein
MLADPSIRHTGQEPGDADDIRANHGARVGYRGRYSSPLCVEHTERDGGGEKLTTSVLYGSDCIALLHRSHLYHMYHYIT